MFQDLDSTLMQILRDPAAPVEVRNADVSFETPDKTLAPAQATVDLFLYDVKENRELRDPTPMLEKAGTTFIRRPPPVRIDCSYIVTAWSNGTAAMRVDQEHRLLGQTLRWLSRFPRIPDTFLQGDLVNELYPPPIMVAQMDPNKNAGDFWIALGIPPRPAFYLTVTVAMALEVAVTGHLVTTRTTTTDMAGATPDAGWVQIGGQVTATGAPGTGIAGATVDIVDAGLRAVTDSEGRYSFPRVPVGQRALRVVAVGYQPRAQVVPVPGRPEDYMVALAPL